MGRSNKKGGIEGGGGTDMEQESREVNAEDGL